MLETLKFVRAAVSKTEFNPALHHFRLSNGKITASNGSLTIQAPLPVDLDCCPHAAQFMKAISACEDVISLTLEGSRLLVKSGRFKSYVNTCDISSFPIIHPQGSIHPISEPLLPVLRRLLPFVATDERKPWACGILFSNHSAIATNSICIVEHWLPAAFPAIVNLPREAVAELVRLKVQPHSLQVSAHAVTFHLPGDAWISCQVSTYKWPDIQRIFEEAESFKGRFLTASDLETLLDDVAKLEKFANDLGQVHFLPGAVATSPQGVAGTSLDNPLSPGKGIFRADQLTALRGDVERIGFDNYPAPVPFYGERFRGVMVGFQPVINS